jgi:hypothetical protein
MILEHVYSCGGVVHYLQPLSRQSFISSETMSHHQTPADQIKEEVDLDVTPLLRSVKAKIETVPKTGPLRHYAS